MKLEEYLNDIQLTREEYDTFVDTWIGIEKLKKILGGKVDGGTALGHKVGEAYSLQGCIVSMITNKHNRKYKEEHDRKGDKGQLNSLTTTPCWRKRKPKRYEE